MMRRTMVIAGLIAFTLVAGEAAALDAYKDRRGLFAGIAVGGGVGASDTDLDGERTGLDSGRQLGLDLSATIGGGATESLVFGAQGNWWLRTVDLGERSLDHQHLNLIASANYFVLEGLYAGGGAGLAYAVFDTARGGETTFTYRELGLAAKVGVGFEFFINGTTAIGFGIDYTRHFYNSANFDTVSGAVTVRWY